MQLDRDPGTVDAVMFDAGGVLVLPDPAAGRAAFRTLGYEPTDDLWCRALYTTMHGVRDDDLDVAGAEAARLYPVHVDPYDLCDRNDHAHIATLDELVEWLVG